ncbi:MAG: lytic transglycosylase domain-containing protein [Candidatus Kapabacteria bacterium]|nr:lytic transglycosylase domain-containing protein [Candidatus Kapabacteria bacterium]
MNVKAAQVTYGIIYDAALEIAPMFGYDPADVSAVMTAIAFVESTFNANARVKPPHTARGLLQINNITQKEAEQELGLPASGDTKIFDPSYNARLGVYMFCKRLKRCGGDVKRGVVAYNQGNCSKPAQLRAAVYLLKWQSAYDKVVPVIPNQTIVRQLSWY